MSRRCRYRLALQWRVHGNQTTALAPTPDAYEYTPRFAGDKTQGPTTAVTQTRQAITLRLGHLIRHLATDRRVTTTLERWMLAHHEAIEKRVGQGEGAHGNHNLCAHPTCVRVFNETEVYSANAAGEY
jgi:hypothetical protein